MYVEYKLTSFIIVVAMVAIATGPTVPRGTFVLVTSEHSYSSFTTVISWAFAQRNYHEHANTIVVVYPVTKYIRKSTTEVRCQRILYDSSEFIDSSVDLASQIVLQWPENRKIQVYPCLERTGHGLCPWVPTPVQQWYSKPIAIHMWAKVFILVEPKCREGFVAPHLFLQVFVHSHIILGGWHLSNLCESQHCDECDETMD